MVAAGFGACADIDVILGVEGNAEDAARTGAVKGVDDVVDDVVEKEELANAPSRRCADVEFALANSLKVSPEACLLETGEGRGRSLSSAAQFLVFASLTVTVGSSVLYTLSWFIRSPSSESWEYRDWELEVEDDNVRVRDITNTDCRLLACDGATDGTRI